MTTWLTLREAGDYARVSSALIARAVKQGYLVAYPIGTGTQYRLRAEDVDEWMMSRAWEPRGSYSRLD